MSKLSDLISPNDMARPEEYDGPEYSINIFESKNTKSRIISIIDQNGEEQIVNLDDYIGRRFHSSEKALAWLKTHYDLTAVVDYYKDEDENLVCSEVRGFISNSKLYPSTYHGWYSDGTGQQEKDFGFAGYYIAKDDEYTYEDDTSHYY